MAADCTTCRDIYILCVYLYVNNMTCEMELSCHDSILIISGILSCVLHILFIRWHGLAWCNYSFHL